MSEKKSSASYPPKRTDTLIGPHLRVEGNVEFSGVLRVAGEIRGDVACPADSRGTMVVEVSGSVIGAVQAPHQVVKGRRRGPTHSAQSLEIHAGAHSVGDTWYRTIDVHRGGVLEGLLTHVAGSAGDAALAETSSSSAESSASPSAEASASDDAARSLGDALPAVGRPDQRRKLAWSLVLAIAVLTVLWINRQPAETATLPAPAPAEAVVAPVAPVVPAAGPARGDGPVGAVTAVAAPGAGTENKGVAPVAPAASPDPEMKKVVTIEGLNPAKSAGIVFLIAREPSVLFKKRRDDASLGKPIELARGRNVSMPIARNELLRVAKGHELEIFYQGRKVPPVNIESGVWMSFAPLATGEAAAPGEARQ